MLDKNGTYILRVADLYVADNKIEYFAGSPDFTECKNMAFVFDYSGAVELVEQMDFVPEFIDTRGL